MITKAQACARINVRTSNRLPESDRDTGRVIDSNPESATGHEVLVAWDSGTRTWCERSQLFAR